MRVVRNAAIAVALWVSAYGPAAALSYVFFEPRHNGVLVAGCPTAQHCRNGILDAASHYCRAKGYDRASNYKTDGVRSRPGALHMPTGSVCRDPNCIMFTEITCTPRAARVAPPSSTAVRINRPSVNGVAIDWCARWVPNCGGTSPNLVCQRYGMARAISYATYLPGRTYIMGSNQYCVHPNCRGLDYVMCTR